ncbi:hypothetical protein KNP414_03424 [Paenibacillus mucilaginosus KNP414]|uniref:Uncharacterized protein n=1 Tax=Paenibacillus mucilaginosus (strain KNP414) TaxID=1036673 RepID=F8F8S0_PAEMK|nr:hypothetical protein KNP414_03424 [Paenibacillus mucilaginosus KNP414]
MAGRWLPKNLYKRHKKSQQAGRRGRKFLKILKETQERFHSLAEESVL